MVRERGHVSHCCMWTHSYEKGHKTEIFWNCFKNMFTNSPHYVLFPNFSSFLSFSPILSPFKLFLVIAEVLAHHTYDMYTYGEFFWFDEFFDELRIFGRIFWKNFWTNVLDESYNLLTVASFRIEVPSILFFWRFLGR